MGRAKRVQKSCRGGGHRTVQPGVRQREQPRGYTSAGPRTHPVRTCGANFGTRHGSQRTVMGPAWPGRGDAVRRAGGAVPSTGHGVQTRAVHVCGCGVCEQTHPCMHPALCARQVQCCPHGTTVSVRVGHVGGGAGHAHEGGVALRGHGAPTPAPHADHRDFFRAGSPARGAPLRRCAAPSAAWRAHRAPERERRTVGPRAAQTPGSERGARRLGARDCGGGCGQNAAGLGTSRG